MGISCFSILCGQAWTNYAEEIHSMLAIWILDSHKNIFQLILDDPSGYSTIENLHLPFPDPKLEIRYYGRTKEQNEALGLQHDDQATIKDDLAAGDGSLKI